MNEVSASANRISAALRALRQVYADSATDKAVLGLKCLQAVMVELAADGVPADDLKPLADLETLVAAAAAPAPAPALAERQRDRRRKAPPSNALLARSAAVIDLLVKNGQGEEGAAQTVMRHLLVAGVPAPERGGDSRGWRRLLEFRNTLVHGGGPEEARVEYAAFARELDDIPPAQRVHAALSEKLWDRRRQARRQAG
ncbi:hypothetical protein [Methyloceanibacter sp. wino2]|uniref:hypothetical protein n=1 Tax=Methyloceanibacter sp. wino2 TaxID=2170729 RepID=UPI000D3EB98D|nr:hypothetical protein [Methyloceanibacter sp. wino2]